MAKGRKTGGRQKGSVNKVTAEIKALAQKHGPNLIQALVDMAADDEAPHAARVAATKEVLDRGFGKPAQAIVGGGEDDNPLKQIIQVVTGVPR